MSTAQALFLAISLLTAMLCLRSLLVSLRHSRRYRGIFWRSVRVYSGAIVSALLAMLALVAGYDGMFGSGVISALDWARAAVHLAIGALFLSTLRAFERRDHLETRLAAASQTDPLTQLPNRAGFDALAAPLLDECAAKGLPATVAMLDIDCFKAVNDGWGHPAGDEVLRSLAQMAREAMRSEDVLARYGGEEFILLLKGVGPETARPMVERVREAISRKVVHPSGEGRITVSGGIAPVDGAAVRSLNMAIHRADEALYMAKDAGRDRSIIYPADGPQHREAARDSGRAMA